MAKKKSSNLEGVLVELNSVYGDNTVNKVKNYGSTTVETFPTGSIKLDKAVGGGFPRGRIVEIFGAESSSKTTICLHAMAEVQKLKENVAFIDFENTFDESYATSLGLNVDEVILSQPDYMEQGFHTAFKLMESGEVSLIVFDSVSAMMPKRQFDGEFGDAVVGLLAKTMSTSLPKLNKMAHSNNCTMIFINQTREAIGVMYGDPTRTSGGNALKFYASLRIRTSKHKKIDGSDGEVESNEIKYKVIKNKVAPPFREVMTEVRFGTGIWIEKEIIEIGVENGVVDKKGAFYYYEETKLGQGIKNVMATLDDNPDLLEEIKEKCLDQER